MMTLNTLHSFEKNHTVEDILCAYFEVRPNKLMHVLTEDESGEIDYWSDILMMSTKDLLDWIEASLKSTAKFEVVNEEGSSGGYPDCMLDLGAGVGLSLSWVVDD